MRFVEGYRLRLDDGERGAPPVAAALPTPTDTATQPARGSQRSPAQSARPSAGQDSLCLPVS
jgi:hypothetical protein